MKHWESLSWARGMFQGARSVGPSLTGREKNGLARSLGMWHIQIEMCALKISLGFLAVPGYHNCCMELMLSSKWCISKFLSKGLFFYYLLNFQTFSNFGRKKGHTWEVLGNYLELFVCHEVVLWLRTSISYLTDIIPLPHSTK